MNREIPLQRAIRLQREKVERERIERETAEAQQKDPRFHWPAAQQLINDEIGTANATLERGHFDHRYELALDAEPSDGVATGKISVAAQDDGVRFDAALVLAESGELRVFVEAGDILSVPVWDVTSDTVQRLLGQLYEKLLNGRGDAPTD